MKRLGVNIDHIATVRNARGSFHPDPFSVAKHVMECGAHSITIHLREDRRHIQDEDVRIIRKKISTPLNLEMAPTEEMVKMALEIQPYQVSLVPEKRQEITTEGGLDLCSQETTLSKIREKLHYKKILLSLFIDPDDKQVDAAKRIKADSIEINTGKYSELLLAEEIEAELGRIQISAKRGVERGLKVFAGHGLNYENVKNIAAIPEIEELNIGHFIVGQAIYVGMENAVREMIHSIKIGRGQNI
mgnify:CR=1 FL=1